MSRAQLEKAIRSSRWKLDRESNELEVVAIYHYEELDGSSAFARVRLVDANGEKHIRPARLDENGRLRRSEPPFAQGTKPLYNVREIANRPGEAVFFVEGEKCVDALAVLGLLATTSGSADSANSCALEVLRGRRVIIWPDNDEPGLRLEREVAHRLAQLGCSVESVDIDLLSLPARGDVVDWLQERTEATHAADVLALTRRPCMPLDHSHRESRERRPAKAASPATGLSGAPPLRIRVAGGEFTEDDGWIIFTSNDPKRDEDDSGTTRVCTDLRVSLEVRDEHGAGWGRLVAWLDRDGREHQEVIACAQLEPVERPIELIRLLVNGGLVLGDSKDAPRLLQQFIKRYQPVERGRVARATGWCGNAYARPGRVYSPNACERTVLAIGDCSPRVPRQSGTLEAWQAKVSGMAPGNPELMFAISCGFAGPLLRVVGEPSGGFHFVGESSTGKSTLLRAAVSVSDSPSEGVLTWRSTSNGLEAVAAVHNDSLLALDEIGECDPEEVGAIAYMLGNGQGKTRARKEGGLRDGSTWRAVFLSSGEESLAARIAHRGVARDGQRVRFADIPIRNGADGGIFSVLHGHPDSAEAAVELNRAIEESHGHSIGPFLEQLVRLRSDDAAVVSLRRRVESVFDGLKALGLSNTASRVARRFAVVAVAGELATDFGLTGWESGAGTDACAEVFKGWLQSFEQTGDDDADDILSHVRLELNRIFALRTNDVVAGTPRPGQVDLEASNSEATAPNTTEYVLSPVQFKALVPPWSKSEQFKRALSDAGWLVGDSGRPSSNRRSIQGRQERVYVLRVPRL